MQSRRKRAATDVGGTFTDLVYYEVDPETGRPGAIRAAKSDTTPPEFDRGVMNVMDKADVDPASLDFFAHGSTVVINALTERKGARTALITTRGFRDVLEIARGNRPDLFNFNFRKPAPFVERHLRAELTERANHKGETVRDVELSELPEILDYFRKEGVEAIAIAFLHAYLAPENERKTLAAIRDQWPEVSVLASHEISREWREYERTNTTVLSAYVHPAAKKYIERLEGRLRQHGFERDPYMMQSNGGITGAEAAKANPVAMVESGPASGIYAAAYMGRAIGKENLIVLDIGGTTAKCALVENGKVKISTDYYIERTPKNPGYPIQTPVVDIVEIGNGGGSIAWVDEGGKLHVGPQSAGASPGPAAYGRGGSKATTTDANLLLGRIDPKSFVGGEVEPDWRAVKDAFGALSERLKLSVEDVARGVVRIANANMVNALRLVSTNKGHDPRDFSLIAFGGGGAMHAVSLAEELNVPEVIVPVNSAVFSAWGMLLTDLRRDYVRTRPTPLHADFRNDIARAFSKMRDRACVDFTGEVGDCSDLKFNYLADMRYQGQEHTVKVDLPPNGDGGPDMAAAAERFHELHEQRFTYRLDAPIQIVNFHLAAFAPVDKPDLAEKAVTGRKIEDAHITRREVDFDSGGVVEADIYDGLKMEPGMTLTGPAVVQEPAVTLVIPPGKRLSVDKFGNYRIQISAKESGQ